MTSAAEPRPTPRARRPRPRIAQRSARLGLLVGGLLACWLLSGPKGSSGRSFGEEGAEGGFTAVIVVMPEVRTAMLLLVLLGWATAVWHHDRFMGDRLSSVVLSVAWCTVIASFVIAHASLGIGLFAFSGDELRDTPPQVFFPLELLVPER
ncbi:hypothetical protein LG314_04455 [Agrococcus terreus]|uniref:hypothetical protein n=1 Tax=Agrococcus terreus TaxID=574649 RepID=UPI00384D1E6F